MINFIPFVDKRLQTLKRKQQNMSLILVSVPVSDKFKSIPVKKIGRSISEQFQNDACKKLEPVLCRRNMLQPIREKKINTVDNEKNGKQYLGTRK